MPFEREKKLMSDYGTRLSFPCPEEQGGETCFCSGLSDVYASSLLCHQVPFLADGDKVA